MSVSGTGALSPQPHHLGWTNIVYGDQEISCETKKVQAIALVRKTCKYKGGGENDMEEELVVVRDYPAPVSLSISGFPDAIDDGAQFLL